MYLSHLETYVERDVRMLVKLKDADLFRRFLQLVAGRTGQLLNKESLARDTGIDPKTVEVWLSALEASFVIVRLHPFHVNLGKRLIETAKVFMIDTGLACHLLRIEEPRHLTAHSRGSTGCDADRAVDPAGEAGERLGSLTGVC